MMGDPTALSWPLLVVAALAGLALTLSNRALGRFSRPSALVGIMCVSMVLCGTWSYYSTREFFPSFFAPINHALAYAAIGIGAAALSCRLVTRLPTTTARGLAWSWNVGALDGLILVFLVLTLIGTAGSVIRIGYVPILRGDIRDERLLYAGQAGAFFRLSLLGVATAILGGVRWLAYGRTALVTVGAPLGLVCASLYGPRFFPFVAIAVLFMCYDQYVKRVRLTRLLAGASVIVALGIAGAIRREGEGTFVFDRSDLRPDAKVVLAAIGYLSVPEFRDFAWSVGYYEVPDRRLHGETLLSATVGLLPAPVWTLVGVDKEALYSRDSATIMAEILNQDTGIRIGLIGELYMNFGLGGILVGMLVFGALVGYLDRRLARGSITDPFVPLVALVTIISVFAMIGIVHMFVSSIVLFGWPLLLAALVAARRQAVGAPVAAEIPAGGEAASHA